MRLSLRSPRTVLATLLTGAAVAAIPATAGAQSLQSVAISTYASSHVLVLDVAGGSTDNGAGVIQWYGHFGANQRWNLVDQGDGTETIVNQNSGKCLTTDGVAGHQIYQITCVGSPLQMWKGTLGSPLKVGGQLVNPYTRLAMDVEGGSRWAGARVISWYSTGSDNQAFAYYQLF